MFVKVGDRVRYIGKLQRFRYGDWPADAWVQKGVKGIVTKIYPADRDYDPEQGKWYTIPMAAGVKWDNGGHSLIHDGEEGQTWEKIQETEPVKGEQAGMLGVPSKYVEQKRPWTPGQMGFESYAKYIEAMDRKYNLAELKQLCRQQELSTSGDKKTLVRRLF